MLLRNTDPFRDFDRLTQQLLGTTNRPVVMPMDAWREGEKFVIEFDLPGVGPDSIDLDVERNVLTVSAERPRATATGRCWPPNAQGACSAGSWCSVTTSTRPHRGDYDAGVLPPKIPVAEKAKPRKIEVGAGSRAGRDRSLTSLEPRPRPATRHRACIRRAWLPPTVPGHNQRETRHDHHRTGQSRRTGRRTVQRRRVP